MRIARVFPRRTTMTPRDELAFVGLPPMLDMPEVDAVHISVAFTWDIPYAEFLAEAWRAVGVPIDMGGTAYKKPGGAFVPGMYLREGMTITSRGCPNHCWFCAVPERDGALRELPIHPGWNVLDDNLLACSDEHVKAVFAMLGEQEQNAVFSGGLEAKLLKPWHCEALAKLKPKRMYFAYDTPDDYDPLVQAGRMLINAGYNMRNHSAGCYVLIGYPGDTFDKAEKRLTDTVKAGFVPYAMLYRDDAGNHNKTMETYQREWLRPKIVGAKMRVIMAKEAAP